MNDWCKFCAADLEPEFAKLSEICDWCYAEQCIAAYDADDAADDVQQQMLDEGER